MWLGQQDVIEQFELEGTGPWTTVYSSVHESKVVNSGYHCAFAPMGHREKAVGDPAWDLMIRGHGPGFTQSYAGDEPETTYDRFGGLGPVEPLLIHREFHGAKPAYVEVLEEFRLYHNLFWDSATSSFIKIYDDGTQEVAIEMGDDLIRVKTKFLRQYQAARQLDLLIFIDSVRYARNTSDELPAKQEVQGPLICSGLYPGDNMKPHFTRFLATKVLPPPPQEFAGIWPFEAVDSHFPDFIIGSDENGQETRFSCNPDALANYFGANPDAPNYLTPVHFRREVLKKYYNNSELFTVEDGYLRCAGLWGLRMDNDRHDRVVVFLGDLGRDLPKSERDYWRSFNITPDAEMSRTGIRRAFLGQFADPESADLRFRRVYVQAQKDWLAAAGWQLLREPVGPDGDLLQQIRLPLDDTDSEFTECIGRLAKLLCDGLNDKALISLLPSKVENEKSIAKLQRWLEAEGYPEVERDIKFLRDLQELRSTNVAHLKGSKYKEVRTRIFGDKRNHEAVALLLTSGMDMLQDLTDWIASPQLPTS